MRAITFTEFGEPSVLHVAEVPRPEPGAGQIRVRVGAAGVNPLDGKIRSGAMRALFPISLPAVLGIDVAGTVDALGPGVTGVAVGDRVAGWAEPDGGAYGEYALVRVFAPVPPELSFEEAVTLPVAVETANQALGELGVSAGETLLVHGASGGVGIVVVQFAAGRGATVIGTASEAGGDRVRAAGGIPTGYGPGLVERVRALAPQGVDAVLDVAGMGALPASIELRGGTERILTLADPRAGTYGVPFARGGESRDAAELADALGRLVRGELRTYVAAVLPFTEAAEAHRLVDSGHAGGKVVLVP